MVSRRTRPCLIRDFYDTHHHGFFVERRRATELAQHSNKLRGVNCWPSLEVSCKDFCLHATRTD